MCSGEDKKPIHTFIKQDLSCLAGKGCIDRGKTVFSSVASHDLVYFS
jgi:hypothetical protein